MAVSLARYAGKTSLEYSRTAPELRSHSARVERLYALLQERMTRPQTTWGDDVTVLDTDSSAQLPLLTRRARAFEKHLLEMPIVIEDDDLIVGNSVQDGVIVRTSMPGYATPEEHKQASEEGSSIAAQLSHKTPYYADVLEKGLSGVLAEIDAKLADFATRPPSEERDEKTVLFEAMRLECQAVVALAHRYADLAEKLAGEVESIERRQELLSIAEVCRWVPEFPAQTFHQATQAFWFVHYASFSTGTSISCGRLDQFLDPMLQKDLDAGAIDIETAQELIDCVWLRFNDRGQIVRENFFEDAESPNVQEGPNVKKSPVIANSGPKAWAAGHRNRFAYAEDAADAINHFGQNILLSGIRPDGADGTNELSYLCLNALEKFALTSPVVTVRLHKESPPELAARTSEVLKAGSGMPYINNDDVLIQAYVDLGVTLEDARDYANSNCWETMIQGKSDQELIRGMNFLLFLELALNQGVSRVHGPMGPDTDDPRTFDTFDKLMDAWKTQMDWQVRLGIDYIGEGVENGTLEHSSHGKYRFNPFLSALTRDCIENEQDVIRGGARYTIWHVMGEAVSNTTDAMTAIKRLVYDEKSLSMDDILAALESDWQDHENIRQRLIARAPKFANDDDYADSIGQEMMNHFVERSRVHAARHPSVIYPPSVGTFSWYTMIGKEVGPTPDGRYYGDPIAANFSPAPGADQSGPTAAIKSYIKMPVSPLAAGAPLDLRLAASGLQGEPGTQRMAGLINAFVGMGGNMLTLTVTDVEELKRAMEEPEKYRHLRVRMGGWSAYFVMLGEEQQRLHITRVEHGLV
ncbi:MAG: pyruvate formate lyase family protein [SAR202 cluster bacterium]|nr:pyruvate formate lyase family protein [SAR202 cluster bacterium]MDP6512895.1 pyruvate formate lyase family protein [SAR202 cluster bacterium]MDP6713119.1 pyruvate formate lyase family protein [SAR202 cluster bacterium]